jgi:hypothetical protein
MNILNKTKTYLVGHMQYSDGSSWRQSIRPTLEKLNITVFDPYDKPFIKDVDEGNEIRSKLKHLMQNREYEEVQKVMKEIRIYDLNLVDRSDFIIAHIIPDVASWGSAEELVTANRAKKPIFLSIEGGKKNCPLWILGMIPHRYIYNNLNEVLLTLKMIDNGELSIDSNRWRLLKEQYR